MKSDVTIVVATWNSESILRLFVEYLQKFTAVPFNLIVVDNGSKDGTAGFLQNLDALVVRNLLNVGVVKALEQAEKLVETKYLVSANDDILVSPGWLESLIEVYESDKSIKIVAPFKQGTKIRYPYSGKNSRDVWDSLKLKNQGKEPEFLIDHFCQGKGYERFVEDIKDANNFGNDVLECPPDFLPGCCVLVETEFIRSIGGLVDTRFQFYGCEDIDRCWRIGKAGYKVVRISKAYIHHFERVSVKNNNLSWKRIIKENNKKLVEKWDKDFWRIFRKKLKDFGDIPQLVERHWIYAWLLESVESAMIPRDLRECIENYLNSNDRKLN